MENCEIVASSPCHTEVGAGYAYIETPISSPSNWLTRDQISGDREDKEKADDSFNNEDIPPFSSSPLDFVISNDCSSRSSGSAETSLTSAHSDNSPNFSRNSSRSHGTRTPFIRELDELLLRAQQEHRFLDRTNYSFYSPTSLMQTPEFSFSLDVEKEASPGSKFSPQKRIRPLSNNSSERQDHEQISEPTISPMKPKNCPRLLPSHESTNKENSGNYRVIKRARSCSVAESFQDDGGPPEKRIKNGQAPNPRVHDRIYARRSASLRRADSLHTCIDEELPTPLGSTARPILPPLTPRPKNAELAAVQANITSPVPIIAPPLDHGPKLPLSPEAVSKIRIIRLLEREVSGRKADGLSPGICERPPHWMAPESGDVNPSDLDDHSSIEDDIRFEWEVVMGLGSKRRRSIVDWLLHVLPIRPLKALPSPSVSPSPPSSVYSSGSSASTSSTESSQLEIEHNLWDQLERSPDTRFHAVWMFLRFFYLMMPHDMDSNNEKERSPKTSISHTSKTLQHDGLALVAWDVAVACLSLSVKFHRDFLSPLLPVYSHEYLLLAPHVLTHEDLESAHRDVLAAFDYRLGVTPQAVMDLLWLALPSLRSVLDFDEGWQKAQQGTWSCLFGLLRESDVQRFPVSVLTAVSLMDSVSNCLIREYRGESLSDDPSSPDGSVNFLRADILQAIEDDCQERAQADTEGVFCDIQALIGLTDADLRDCRLWIARID